MPALSIRQIKDILDANGTDYSDCIEKADFLRKLDEVRKRAKTQQKAGRGSAKGRSSSQSRFGSGARSTSSPRGRPTSSASDGKAEGCANTAPVEDIIQRINSDRYNYYKVLGQAKNCSEADIKKAYKRLALKLHPDKCTLPGAEDAFKALAEAHDTLKAADKRAEYDRYGVNQGSSSGASGMRGNPFQGFGGGGADLDDILRHMMGQGGGFRFAGGPGGPQFFFGGGTPFGNMGGGGFRNRAQRRAHAEEDDDGNAGGGGGGFGGLLQSPVLLMLLMMFGPMLLSLVSNFLYVIPLLWMLPRHRLPQAMIVIFCLKMLNMI